MNITIKSPAGSVSLPGVMALIDKAVGLYRDLTTLEVAVPEYKAKHRAKDMADAQEWVDCYPPGTLVFITRRWLDPKRPVMISQRTLPVSA